MYQQRMTMGQQESRAPPLTANRPTGVIGKGTIYSMMLFENNMGLYILMTRNDSNAE